jgi:hypothetical protein
MELLCTIQCWNGYQAAFSFSTDDGFIENLYWSQVFQDFGFNYTIFIGFIVTDFVSDEGKIGWSDIYYLDSLGNEIASHSVSHRRLLTDSAFTIRYIGAAEACSIRVFHDSLWINSLNDNEDICLYLEDSQVTYLVDLVSFLIMRSYLACTLKFWPDSVSACKSSNLRSMGWNDIKGNVCLVRTWSGVSFDTLMYEVLESKSILEDSIREHNSNYQCRSFAYPYHSHDIRTMIVLRDSAGYIVARDGPRFNPDPWGGSEGRSTWDTVTLYNIPLYTDFDRINGPDNSFSEDSTRAIIRSMIQTWKENHVWANLYAHKFNDQWEPLDTTHLRWILEEIAEDGEVWVAPFSEVAKFVRRTHLTYDGWHWIPKNRIVTSRPIKKFKISEYSYRMTGRNLTIAIPWSDPLPSLLFKCNIFDVTGRYICSLTPHVSGDSLVVLWNGKNWRGSTVKSGLYLFYLMSKNGIEHSILKILYFP